MEDRDAEEIIPSQPAIPAVPEGQPVTLPSVPVVEPESAHIEEEAEKGGSSSYLLYP